MAMNATVLKNEMKTAVLAAIQALYANIPNNHQLAGYTTADFWDKVCGAIATTTVNHIKNNARCSGTDSHGDTHDLVGIL